MIILLNLIAKCLATLISFVVSLLLIVVSLILWDDNYLFNDTTIEDIWKIKK